jgi:hypothetical protein
MPFKVTCGQEMTIEEKRDVYALHRRFGVC